MTEEELRTKQELKRQAQHRAWKKWYSGEGGRRYKERLRLKRLEKKNDQTS